VSHIIADADRLSDERLDVVSGGIVDIQPQIGTTLAAVLATVASTVFLIGQTQSKSREDSSSGRQVGALSSTCRVGSL